MARLMFESTQPQEVNVNQQGSMIAQQDAANILTEQQNKGKILDLVGTAGKAAVAINTISKENEVRVNREKVKFVQGEYISTINTPEYLEGSTTSRIEQLSSFNKKMADDGEVAGAAAVEYSSAKMGNLWNNANKEVDKKDLEGVPYAYTVRKEDVDFRTFVNEQATLFPRLSKRDIRDAAYTGESAQGDFYIADAPNTPEGLQEALADVEDLEKDIQEAGNITTSEAINKAKRLRAKAISDKQALIVLSAKKDLANVAASGNIEDVDKVNKSIDAAFTDPITNQKKKEDYLNTYNENITNNVFLAENPIGEPLNGVPPDNKAYKEQRQVLVTESLVSSFKDMQPSRTNEIAINEPGLSKPFGQFLLSNINGTEDAGELKGLFAYVSQLNPTVANNMFSATEYKKIIGLSGMTVAYPDKSLTDIRGMIQQAEGSVGSGKMSPNDNADMLSIANDMPIGIGNQYRQTIEYLTKIDAGVAESQYKSIAEIFQEQSSENTAGIQMDNSIALPRETLNPERTDALLKEYASTDMFSAKYLTQDVAMQYDKDGWLLDIVNTKTITEESDNLETVTVLGEKKASKEAVVGKSGIVEGVTEGAKVATKAVLRTITDNFLNTVVAVPKVLGELGSNMGSRFLGHLWDSMTEGQQEFFSIDAKKDPVQEAGFQRRALQAIEESKKKYDVEGQLKDVDTSKLSEQEKQTLPYKIADNNKKIRQLDDIRYEVQSDRNDKLKKLESSKPEGETTPYVDGDFYSVGYGHFLTPKEKTQYEGLSESQKVVQNTKWFKEDLTIHENRARKVMPNYDELSTNLQNQLLFATYRGSITGSPKTLSLIKNREFKKASKEFLNNKEYKNAGQGLKDRMEAVARALEEEA